MVFGDIKGKMTIRLSKSQSILILGSALSIILLLAAGWAVLRQNPELFRQEPLTKVVVIGLDGASWNIIEPLLAEDKLPNLKRLMDHGVYGPLESCCDTLSPSVWTTIVTGRDRVDHGIYDFTMTDPRTGRLVKVNNSHRQVKALWEIMNGFGMRMGLVNLFVAYPFDKFDGFAYDIERGEMYPELLLPPGEIVRAEEPNPQVTFSLSNRLVKKEWDLFFVYDRAIDAVQHRTWHYYEPEKFDRRKWLIDDADIAAHRRDIPDTYEEVDRRLGEFLAALGDNVAVVVVSDHGGMANADKKSWYLLATNRILADADLMRLDPGMLPLPQASPLYVMEGEKPALGNQWDRSVAYAVDPVAARRVLALEGNLADRDISEAILEKMRSLRVGGLNLPLFTDLQLSSKSDNQETAPVWIIKGKQADLLNQIDADLNAVSIGPGGRGKILAEYVIRTPAAGVHAPYGVIILSGPMFKDDLKIEDASVYDVMPTMLSLLGLPAADDMPGRVLTEAFTEDFAAKLPPKRYASYESGKPVKKVKLEPLQKPEQDKLRSLGYL